MIGATYECIQTSPGKSSHVVAMLEFIWRHVSEVGYTAGLDPFDLDNGDWVANIEILVIVINVKESPLCLMPMGKIHLMIL